MRATSSRARRAFGPVALVATLIAFFAPPGEGVPARAAGVHPSMFKNPGAMAVDPLGHLWIANSDRFGITEVSAATGRYIRIVREPGYTFNDPIAMAVAHGRVWVLDGGVTYANGRCSGGIVVVLSDRTGTLERLINLKRRGVHCVTSMVTDGQHVWVDAAGGERLVEMSAATGSVEREIIRGPDISQNYGGMAIGDGRIWYTFRDGLAARWAGSGAWIGLVDPTLVTTIPGQSVQTRVQLDPIQVTTDRALVFAAGAGGRVARRGGSLSVINASIGAVVRIEQPIGAGLINVGAMVSGGGHVWMTNVTTGVSGGTQGNSVDEFDAVTGRFVRLVYIEDGPYSSPSSLAIDGARLLVSDPGGGNVLEYSLVTGRLVGRIGPPPPKGYSPT